MLQSKRSSHQIINRATRQSQSPLINRGFHIRRTESKNILDSHPNMRVDLDVQNQQGFVCFQCANQQVKMGCRQCGGTGMLSATHPLVQLMNDIFNAKFIPPLIQPHKKDMVSTKTSSNSSISDQFPFSQKSITPSNRNSPKYRQSKYINSPQQHQKSPFLDSLFPTLPSMIKQQSTIDQKSKKCNICHYQFESVKYMCPQCQNYNVCEQCYRTKRISHGHQLKKIQSVTSQSVCKTEESQKEQVKEQKQHMQLQQHLQQDTDKLSLHSNQSAQLIFGNNLKTDPFPSYHQKQSQASSHQGQHPHSEGMAFFKLHQVQTQHNDNQLCNTCQQHFQDCCYWICETCKEQGKLYQLCKECYDHQLYEHPKDHRLGLNFFTLEDDFLMANEGDNFFDTVKEDTSPEEEFVDFKARSHQKENIKPTPTIPSLIKSKSNIASGTTSIPEMLNIGIINGHKNIFTGFHKENENSENEHYKNEIISPIPRSLKLAHLFKDKKQTSINININNESDGDIMVQLMSSSVNSTPKKSIQIDQKTPKKKQNFGDQSRVYFGENIMMNLQLSQDYNQPIQNQNPNSSTQLYRSQIKYRQSTTQPKKIANLLPNITLIQINPQTSILDSNQQEDYYFTEYFCDICNINPIRNIKYHCLECEDYDLCENCYLNNRVEHWHDHFRKDDGRLKSKKIFENKKKIITKVVNNLNRSLSPTRRSFMYLK